MSFVVSSLSFSRYTETTMPAFSIVSIVLLAVWLLLFAVGKHTRREQLIMSLLGIFISPGALLFAATDYRAGEAAGVAFTGFPELLFGFAVFGIAAVLHEHLPHKRQPMELHPKSKLVRPIEHWLARLCVVSGVWLFVAVAGNTIFHLPSVSAFILGGALVGVYVIADRKDLVLEALLSGVFITILIFLIEQFFFVRLYPEAAADFWKIGNLSGLILGGIPVEELLWAAIVGFSVGPLYEFVSGTRPKPFV